MEYSAFPKDFHQDEYIAGVGDGVAAFSHKFPAQCAVVEYRFDICVWVPWSRNVNQIAFKVAGFDPSICCHHVGKDGRRGHCSELHEGVAEDGNVLVWDGLKQ